jgi:hypothetical protein
LELVVRFEDVPLLDARLSSGGLGWGVSPVGVVAVLEELRDLVVVSNLPAVILMVEEDVSVGISVAFVGWRFGVEGIGVWWKIHWFCI